MKIHPLIYGPAASLVLLTASTRGDDSTALNPAGKVPASSAPTPSARTATALADEPALRRGHTFFTPPPPVASGIGVAQLRKDVVGVYEAAGFPTYITAGDGYPVTTDIDNKMLIGFGGNGDRYEDWLTNLKPIHDSQQSFDTVAPLSGYPRMSIQDATGAVNQARPIRDIAGNFQIIGHVEGTSAVHTGGDIPCSAFGRGAKLFNGTIDNTDVFFKAMQAAIGGAAN